MESHYTNNISDQKIKLLSVLTRTLGQPVIFSLVCLVAASINYLFFHALAEIFSIVVAFTAMVVATTASRFARNHFVVFVSIAIGWCAGIDLVHTLVFKGMQLLPDDSANPATQMWVAARYLQSLAFVLAPFAIQRRFSTVQLHLAFGGCASVLLALIATGHFPDAYIEGQGLTDFKVYSEYVIIAVLGLAVVHMRHTREHLSSRVYSSMVAAAITMMVSEFLFTRYVSVYAQANLAGHLLKIFSYWFVYIALIRNTIRDPFMMLRKESQAREQLATERGQLLQHLGERVKELSSINAILELSERTDLDVEGLLRGSAQCLPQGFTVPGQVRVNIQCEWGEFGHTRPSVPARRSLSQPMMLGGSQVGTLLAWYPDTGSDDTAHFLKEEEDLLTNASRLICDAIKRLMATERALRLRSLYETLSKTSHAVVHSQSPKELLDSLYATLVALGTFPLFYIVETTRGTWPLKLVRHHGMADGLRQELDVLLSDPRSPLFVVLQKVREGAVSSETIEDIYKGLAISNIPELKQWRDFLKEQGIVNRAVLPLLCKGELQGVVILYARGLAALDEEQITLLQQITAEMGFALDNFESRKQALEAQAQADRMESQFQEVFKASPVPMMISSVDDQRLLAINDALQQLVGYTLSEIPTQDEWFRRVYPDDTQLAELQRHWQQSLQEGQHGIPIQSPLLTLHAKDGTPHLVTGRMTVMGRHAIVAWTDLTDIQKSEQALLESERRFRSMVEQTLAAMYVRRDGRYIYVNPRYTEMTGWSADELLGQPVLGFIDPSPENLLQIHEAWSELHDGQHASVSYEVPFRRKDGELIQLSLTGKLITWEDGKPATILLATDMTEQRRAQKQAAEHLQRIEDAMRGTLQAVSSMVEMRDPYTAGHERRVGLIASAIARQMGWSEERCQNLELLGLVHDIGKIAIPSEILTKPTRLTPLEMQMMRGHAQAGYEILKNVPFPTPVADIIHQHHERMDGSGYPQGLKGEEILPEARILAVADVLESMASHRPYRPAVGLNAALEEVIQNKGTLYDSQVVDAALELIRHKGYQLPV